MLANSEECGQSNSFFHDQISYGYLNEQFLSGFIFRLVGFFPPVMMGKRQAQSNHQPVQRMM